MPGSFVRSHTGECPCTCTLRCITIGPRSTRMCITHGPGRLSMTGRGPADRGTATTAATSRPTRRTRTASSASAPGGQAGITPDVKQAVTDEVRRQLDLERSEGQSQNEAPGDVLPMFADNARHVFVVSDALEVSSSGGACMVTGGDVLQLYGAPPPTAVSADVVVRSEERRVGKEWRSRW